MTKAYQTRPPIKPIKPIKPEPLEEHDLILNKQGFRDSLALLRYGWPIPDLATKCVCGESFDANHALLCAHAGFTIGRHDHLRNLFAKKLKKVCGDVAIEPALIPITGETFDLKSTILSTQANGGRIEWSTVNYISNI